MNWLLSVVITMDPTANLNKIVTLKIEPSNPDHLLECVWLIGVTKDYIWTKRKSKQQIDIIDMSSKI